MVSCPEEIAYRMGYISRTTLIELGSVMAKNGYDRYLLKIAGE